MALFSIIYNPSETALSSGNPFNPIPPCGCGSRSAGTRLATSYAKNRRKYADTKALSKKERDNFFQYHKNDYAHIQFFQLCDEEAYQEFLSCIPERARNYLEAEMPVHGLTWERK